MSDRVLDELAISERHRGSLESKSSLGHYPKQRWEFDESVTKVFEDMLARSIPQIGSMREIVHEFSKGLIQPGTDVVDLGCATGDGISRLVAEDHKCKRFVCIETSEPMIEVAKLRFAQLGSDSPVEFLRTDLRTDYPSVHASLTLAILTIQFIPVEYRSRLLSDIFAHTVPGGGLILVEKILGESPRTDALLKNHYYRHKRAMGYSQEEIDAKRLALEGVLVPLTAAWNENLLRQVGFRHVECIWRCINFCGWVAIA